jgi:hypothetical protein
MSNILKGILNETSPHNYDSDWDYQNAVARSGKSRSSYRSQEDDTSDADIEYSKKMYQLSQKQKRDSDHDRLATGTNEDNTTQTRMRMNDYYDLAEALQEKLRQAIKMGNDELVHELSKERADLDARVKKYGLIPESQLDEISNEKLSQYKTAAATDASKADKEGDYKRGDKRFSGIVKATKKQFANDTKKSGISQGINEFAPSATGPKGPKDYGQPNSSRYIGGNKFVVGTTNNYVLTATIDKWGLEWDEDDEIWFLDSPGAAHIADASEGEIELPPPMEQRNQIHDLVTDYLNARNSADLQKVAAYYGHSDDGEMATNEAVSANRFNSKQEVINHFVKNGKSAAAGSAAWERGYRGSSNKPIELKKPPQRSYHDDLDDKRYSTFENLGDQLKSTSLDALVQAKLAIEKQREAEIEAWKQDFQKNTVQKAQQGLRREFQPTPVTQPDEKHSVLKARLAQLNNAIEKQELLDKLVDRLDRKGLLTPAMQNDTDTGMHVRYGAKDNYQSLNKKLDNAISMLQDRLYIRKKSGLKEVHDERDEYDNPRQGREYGKGNLFVDPGSTEFPKEKHVNEPGSEVGRPKNLKGISKALPADAFGRTSGVVPASARPKSKEDPFKDVDEGWSQKYKSSINCSHPKGFSQKAHCAGKKKHNESIDNVMEMTCPDCGMCQTHGDNSKDKLDELKCWSGYHRVAGTKAGFPGSCAKNKTNEEGVAEGKITLSTDPNWYGATVDNYQASGPVVNIPANQLVGFEPDDKMNQPKSKVNVEKIVAGLKQGAKLPPLLVRKYKNGYQVLDGHHRFWAYKLLGVKSIPAQIVPDSDIEEISKQGVAESHHSESCPHCGGEMVNEELMNEKKDACYYKVKSRYKVWPSAYASGALVKCRKKGADSWGNGGKKNESSILEGINRADESLHDWFNKEKWVRMDTKGEIKGPCAKEPGEGKPKCLPQSKAHSLGKKGRASAAQRKRREDPNPERTGKAINVNTKKKSNENIDEDWKKKLGAAALTGAMALGAAGASADTRRVTPDGQGGFTGGMKPSATVQAEPAPATPSDATIPGQGLVRAERADRQAGTVTVGGQEYKMIMLEPGGIRPRGGQQIVIPQAVMGERGIGNYMAILAGGRVFVLPQNK